MLKNSQWRIQVPNPMTWYSSLTVECGRNLAKYGCAWAMLPLIFLSTLKQIHMLYPKLKVLAFCLAWQTAVLRTRLKGCILSNPSNTRGQRKDWLQMPKDAHNLKGNLMLLRLLSCQAVENVNWRCNYLDDLSLTRLQLYCSNLFLCFLPTSSHKNECSMIVLCTDVSLVLE